MPDEARLVAAFVLALGAAFAATPVAIAVAGRTNFHDRPVGYKGHAARPLPRRGRRARRLPRRRGAARRRVRASVADRRSAPAPCGRSARSTTGVGLAAWPRVAAECGAAIVLWSTGLGWDVLPGDAADLALTMVWVVGLVNAFNLIDNMDGAAATLAAVTSAAIGVLALLEGDVPLAVLVVRPGRRLPRLPAVQPRLARRASSSATAAACRSASWWRRR